MNPIPDWSRPGLTTTAIGAVHLQGAGGNWTKFFLHVLVCRHMKLV